jgi:endonuclease YncB( thermonuclease family)
VLETRTWIVLALLACLVGFTSAGRADSQDFSGIVTRVFDGDSFLVAKTGARGRDIEVRLMDIDAPEKDQPYADVSRSVLKNLIENRRVFVDVVAIDKYDRKVAKVYREPDRLEIARALVRDGHVWVNRRFAKDRSLVTLEEDARSSSSGLWAIPQADRVPPWEFRRRTKKGASAKSAKPSS